MTTGALSSLALEPACFRHEWHDGNVVQHPESHYLDFLIDGRSLSRRFPGAKGMVTLLNRPWLPSAATDLDALVGLHGVEGLDDGRVALYVCGECGDLGCGALTAHLTTGQKVTSWSDFHWEDGEELSDPIESAPSFTFATRDYLAAFNKPKSD